MKTGTKLKIITLIFVTSFAFPTFAKPSNGKVMKLYARFLSSGNTVQFKKTFSYKSHLNKKAKQVLNDPIYLSDCYFNIQDIDRNGVKELVIKNAEYHSYSEPCGMWHYVFTIKAGKVVPMGFGYMRQDYAASFEYLKSKRALLSSYSTAGTESISIYYFKKSKLRKVDTYYRETDWNTDANKCYKNDRRISLSKYKKGAWNLKTNRISLYKNTEWNRASILR